MRGYTRRGCTPGSPLAHAGVAVQPPPHWELSQATCFKPDRDTAIDLLRCQHSAAGVLQVVAVALSA